MDSEGEVVERVEWVVQYKWKSNDLWHDKNMVITCEADAKSYSETLNQDDKIGYEYRAIKRTIRDEVVGCSAYRNRKD